MQIVSISGKAQHGKDTTALFLKDALEAKGRKVLITHYGDLVKYICSTFCEWDGAKDVKGRTLLQRVGTEIFRARNENFWVNFVLDAVHNLDPLMRWDYVLVPDCRFPNEVHGTHIRIIRKDFDNGLTEEQKNHISETALDDSEPNIVIWNEGTLDDLRAMCQSLAKAEKLLTGRCCADG